jgi:hypothetical protein
MGLAAERELPESVHARTEPRCLASRLNGGQQQPDERADDGNHDQQFNERKALSRKWLAKHSSTPH